MTRRWGLQATMTSTYVAVTAGVVLLTELVIFGVAALARRHALTPRQVQGLAQAPRRAWPAKLGKVHRNLTASARCRARTSDLPGTPVSQRARRVPTATAA